MMRIQDMCYVKMLYGTFYSPEAVYLPVLQLPYKINFKHKSVISRH
jgi:hypothetical protein